MLSKEVDKMMAEKARVSIAKQNPDNPAYITLKSRILAVSTELKNLEQQKDRLNQQIEEYQKKVEKAPLLMREYNELMRNYEGAKRKYNEIYSNLLEVKTSQEMIEKEQGERFAIIDHANLPKKPFQPNRLGIMLLGLVLALGAGFGFSAIRESMDNSIKSVSEIQNITGAPVLSVFSIIETKKEKWGRRFKRMLWIFALLCCIGLLLLVIDQYIMKIDEVWTIFLERLKTTV
jgi:predicted RNase H-like nuclease (RuvC/YqgF family)